MGHSRKNPFLGLILGLAQEHSGSDDSLYLVKQIPSNGPRARFHGAPFEIVKSTKLAICVRQEQKDNSASSSRSFDKGWVTQRTRQSIYATAVAARFFGGTVDQHHQV